MARTGTFGRQPRSAYSLTSTLVSIAREWQNQRAQNIMDAWQKGGEFEGKKATDAVVLAFWKEKMDGVSKDDPYYDTYKNAHSQLDYTIHESKMTAQYALHKVSDGAMVSFYLNWAKKVPKDSEFYRVLQRDAGQYMRTARTSSADHSAQRKEEAYQRSQAETQKAHEAGGEYIIETFRRIAQSGNANAALGAPISAPGSGSDYTDFSTEDPATMLRLIEAITSQGTKYLPGGESYKTRKFTGSPDVMYHDDNGRAVTGIDIMDRIGKLDPNFRPGEPMDIGYVTNLLNTQITGIDERIRRAKKTGHMQDVASLTKSKSYVALLKREFAAEPIQSAYMESRADYDAVVNDKSSSPAAILKAWGQHSSNISSFMKDPSIAADDNLRSRLAAELNGTAGVPTLHESFTGLATSQYDPASAKDAEENAAGIEFMQGQVDAVAKSAALPNTDPAKVVWAYGNLDSNGVFTPGAGGRSLGSATIAQVSAGGANMQVVTVDDPLGGTPLNVAVTAVPVIAVARNPVTDEPLAPANTNPIGWQYTLPSGEGSDTQFGFQSNTGFVFSADPPWDETLPNKGYSSGGDHREVDLTSAVAKAFGYGEQDPITGAWSTPPALTKDQELPGLSVVDTVDPKTGQPRVDKSGLPVPGTIVFKPQDFAWSTDSRSGLGLPDPSTDFKSLTLSHLTTSTDGRAILANIDRHPEFKTTMDNDALANAGFRRDEKGAVIPESGDARKLNDILMQQKRVTDAKSVQDYRAGERMSWQRDVTGSPMQGGSTRNQTGFTGPGFTPEGYVKLATDVLQGTNFQALGSAFKPGTSSIAPQRKADLGPGFTIKPVTTIKAPALPDVKPQTNVAYAASTVSTQSVTQSSSQAPVQGGSAPPPPHKPGRPGGGA